MTEALVARGLGKRFRRATGETVEALDGVSFAVEHGTLSALVGPDGAGKTTFLRLVAGLLAPDAGTLSVLGLDVAAEPQAVQDRIGYMPQRFGLYEDLTVRENLDLYADLHGVSAAARAVRYPQLMAMTQLGPFGARLAGRLSGGMKQKLGLACTLVRAPDLLLLDEPTVGVDPLSRRELWEIIQHLVARQGLTVLMSTSYLDEAERCGRVAVLRAGRVLADGPPAAVRGLVEGRTFRLAPPAGAPARELQARLLDDPAIVDAVPEAGMVRFVAAEGRAHPAAVPVAARFEDGFMALLHGDTAEGRAASAAMILDRPVRAETSDAIEVNGLVRRFGTFTAVDRVSFAVRRGEIFGLLGPNGAGKTTTFRMLCGLLPASGGTLRVAGLDLRRARASARQRIGYVAQKFALYPQLTVAENLEFFASAYGLEGQARHDRLAWALGQFELRPLMDLPSEQLPGGYKQRLAMAAALLHEPEILFLDEPTSGADPLARREFWRRITALAEQGVTIVVTTHFMEEAEYCDRVAILDGGRVLAQGTPAELRSRAAGTAEPTMEDAFIAIVEAARGETLEAGPGEAAEVRAEPAAAAGRMLAKLRRLWALIVKEARQVVRDPSSIAIGVAMPVVLILLFGFALSLDVKHVPVAVVMEDASPDAAALAAGFGLSPYFEARLVDSMPHAQALMLRRQVDGIIRLRPDFSRGLNGAGAPVQVLVHGIDANRARIIQGYAEGAIGQWAARQSAEGAAAPVGLATLETRLWFNAADDSHYFLVPGLIVLIMTLIGAFLTSMVMAREWERGTLEALFVTPVRAGEILLGKTLPYFALGLGGLMLCVLAARFLFDVPFRGSILVLVGVSMLYLLVALGIGLLVSTWTKSQFVASQLVMLITFMPALMLSGFLFDLRSMPTAVRVITYLLPARYYVSLLQTVFLAGDVWAVILPNAAVLLLMVTALSVGTRAIVKKRLA